MSRKMSAGQLRRCEQRSARLRGQSILAEKFMEAYAALSLYSRNYAQLDPLERRQRTNRCITALIGSFSIIEGEEHLAPLNKLKRSLHYLDTDIVPPLLARNLAAAGKANKLLTRKAPRTRQKEFIGAWAVAAWELLIAEGKPPKEATDEVMRRLHVSESTVRNWRKQYECDNARLLSLPRGQHLQRLRFRVPLCVNYGKAHQLTGAKMLDFVESDPALVHGLSGLRAISRS